jgi:hypothetical protein
MLFSGIIPLKQDNTNVLDDIYLSMTRKGFSVERLDGALARLLLLTWASPTRRERVLPAPRPGL